MGIVRKQKRLWLLLPLAILALMAIEDGIRVDEDLSSSLVRLAGPLPYDDPDLLRLVSRRFVHPPSALPYHLQEDQRNSNLDAQFYTQYQQEFAYMFCAQVLRELFAEVRSGFFVEAGALDGEFLSNTLSLEREEGWTGLLVEADGDMFRHLLKKGRRAWASHSCLATRSHPHVESLVKFVRQGNVDGFLSHSARAHGTLLSLADGSTLDNSEPGHRIYESVQCLPLATLLLAINVTHVDLVSLDVEGAEVGVLRHFPWDRIKVDVWLVEHVTPPSLAATSSTRDASTHNQMPKSSSDYKHPKTSASSTSKPDVDRGFLHMFFSRGYVLYRVSSDLIIPNYAFILRGSEVYRKLRASKRIRS